MNWHSVNFDWNHARSLLVVAREGSLSAAARALELSQPTLSRQISALEQSLNVSLFERFGKGLQLTQTGLKLVEHVEKMNEAAGLFSLAASGESQSIDGNVVISASETTAAFTLPDIIKPLHQQHPALSIEIVASNSASDLKRREADVAIRGFRPHQPDLIAKRVRDIEVGFYAAKSYTGSNSFLCSDIDFESVSFLGFNQNDTMVLEMNKRGIPVTKENFAFVCDNHMVQWEMVKKGFGIGVMPCYIGDQEASVVRVMDDIGPFVGEQWLVAHRELRTSRRIRVVFDYLADALERDA